MQKDNVKCGKFRRSHSGKNLFQCIQCDVIFYTCHEFVRHMDIHWVAIDNLKHQPTIELAKVETPKTTEEMLLSSLDGDASANFSEIKTHFVCDRCCQTFAMKYKKQHMLSHTDLQPFKCNDCGRGFNTSGALTRHARVHAADYALPSCDYCGISFKTKYVLLQHMLVHTKGNPFNCEPCNRSFMKRPLYEAHMRRHRDEKPFQCSTCGLAFVSVVCLGAHERRHREKKHKCDLCDRAFFKPFQLAEHKIGHTGKRAFTCSICKKSFGSRKVLGQHMRLHDTEKRYKCKICDMTFAQSSGRRKHEKFKHRSG